MNYLLNDKLIQDAYTLARERYAQLDVNTDQVLDRLADISLSLHCWQGDDVGGFENPEGELGGGIAATGNYPGKARNAIQLRSDLDLAYRLIPGKHRLNLHAIYAETNGSKVGRDDLRPEHFSAWLDWAKINHHGLDFNPTCFSHENAASGFTLSNHRENIRRFWVNHCIACRRIGEAFGKALGSPCVTNIWIPDGYKDLPADRKSPRELLRKSLDEILVEQIDHQYNMDAVEPKLFGIGSESYVVGSYDFYLGYAATHDILLTLDLGHFHPTESIADKISSTMLFVNELLLHVSRGVRWDSDHVVILSDDIQALMQEIVRGEFLERVHIGLDYFDASINRVAAWVIGARNTQRALLMALLEPTRMLRKFEEEEDYTARLALLEETKGLPFSLVWDYFCLKHSVPVGFAFLNEIKAYEKTVLHLRK